LLHGPCQRPSSPRPSPEQEEVQQWPPQGGEQDEQRLLHDQERAAGLLGLADIDDGVEVVVELLPPDDPFFS
jgi:hypothetical protein